MGGRVVVNPKGRALGVTPVSLTNVGRRDRLFSELPDGAVTVQWNNDIADRLPAGSDVLARDPRGDIQAARFGRNAWGVQFHPEVNAAVFQEWVHDDSDGTRSPVDGGPPPTRVVADIRKVEDTLEATWRPFAERFASIVRDSSLRGRATSTLR
jgi:GMP synthase (glutamine-hydrolysing)